MVIYRYMDIERLTKNQIVLLTLLVSFVTSIATGIVTVTLLDQAPPAVTQTINRVVERTIERVVPDKSQNASVVTTKEVTIVVKENDLITESIEKNSASVVRISAKTNGVNEGPQEAFVSLGTIVDPEGIVATDGSLIFYELAYTITTVDGRSFDAELLPRSKGSRVMLMKIIPSETLEGDGEEDVQSERVTYSAVIFSDLSVLKLGQSVIGLSGKERTNVSLGIISGLLEKDVVTEVPNEEGADPEFITTTTLDFIETNIDHSDVLWGSPLIDIFGEAIGIHTEKGNNGNALYIPISEVVAELHLFMSSQASGQEEYQEQTDQ